MQRTKRSLSNVAATYKEVKRLVVTDAVVSNEATNLKSWRQIPGPSSLPIIGQLLHCLPGGYLYNNSEHLANVLYKKYGKIVRYEGFFGARPTIFTFDPEIVSNIHRNENWIPVRHSFETMDYFRKVYNKNRHDPNAPTGLSTDQGEIWKKLRSTVNPILLQPKTIKLYATSLSEVADDMIKRMKEIRNDKNVIEDKFDILMNLWALESISVVALGGRINCFDRNLPENSPAKKMIKVVHDIFKISPTLDLKPSLWRYIATPAFKKAMQTFEDQMTLTKYFLEKASEQGKDKGKASNEEKGIVEKLLEINKDMAVTMACEILFAGIDTTANAIMSSLYLLAVNPEKQEKLRAEILSQREKRTYLTACLKETLRIMPVVAGILRETSKEYNIYGYKIPKDMQIFFGHQILSMMEEHFPRPTEFIPERWITDKSDPLYYGNAHPFAYSPFGFGVRGCIGKRIVFLELETFMAKLIENFQIEWVGPPLKTKPFFINHAVGPFNYVFKDIK